MKEELFHFYKERIEPLLKNLAIYLRTFPIFQYTTPKEVPPSFKYQYLFPPNIHNYYYYLDKGVNATPIEIEDISTLDKEVYYLVLGQYDEAIFLLNLLRQKGLKALWDQTWMQPDNHKPLWKRRVSIVEAIYADLITEKIKNREIIILDEKSEWIDFEYQIFQTYQDNKENYKQIVNDYLKEGWELNRLNPITTSIILEAISEYASLKTDKLVLITQSVKTAKNYCGEVDYKIINAILDNYFKSVA